MIAAALVLGLAGSLSASELIRVFNIGWGRALGEFALILLPSFTLASVLAHRHVGAASGLAVMASPIAGAGMICPDTAYATLSPLADRRRLIVAFGSYAGFKLLFPAGPLIVATGLGMHDTAMMAYGLALLIPIWGIGILWVSLYGGVSTQYGPHDQVGVNEGNLLSALAPFVALAMLLIIGVLVDLSAWPSLDFLTNPKGALLVAATWALWAAPPDQRRECLDIAVRRTGSLLLVIGAASAFGSVLTTVVPIGAFVPTQAGILGIVSLFGLTAAFKLAQGSSMATFAAVAPVAAPIVAASDLPPTAAVFAICLGSFVAILPNDSFYWLVRRDALATTPEAKAVAVLGGGATLQAVTGLAILLALVSTGLVS